MLVLYPMCACVCVYDLCTQELTQLRKQAQRSAAQIQALEAMQVQYTLTHTHTHTHTLKHM